MAAQRKTMPKDTESGGVRAAQRLSIPLNDAGLIDMDHIRPSTAARLIELIKTDPTVKQAFDETAGMDAEPATFDGLTQENVATGLDMFQRTNGLVLRVVAARFMKHPQLKDQQGRPMPLVIDQDVLDRTFTLTEKQHAELDPRATRLAQKYSGRMPDWLKKNLDLYIFGSMLLGYTAQNAKEALGAQVKRDLVRAQQAYAQARANQPKNPQADSDAQPMNGHATGPTNREILEPILESLKRDSADAAPEPPTV